MNPAPTVTPEPDQAPEFARRIRLRGIQVAGLMLLLAIPILALFQLLGDRRGEHSVEVGGVTLAVDYPGTARFGKRTHLRLEISGEVAGDERRVRLELPASYLGRFDDVRAFPDAVSVTSQGYALEVPLSSDGTAAPVLVNLMPKDYGRARGALRVWVDGRDASVPLETLIFP